jgi:hypothetical protein
VIETLAYFPFQCAQNSGSAMSALLDSARAAGIRTVDGSYDADAAVIWSVLWHGRMKPNQSVYKHYVDQGRPVIVVDVGALHRGTTWKVAINNITADGYYGHTEDLDAKRPEQLGLALFETSQTNPAILIASQHQQSLQTDSMVSQESWINSTIQELRRYTDRPVVIRPHPRSRINHKRINYAGDVRIESPRRLPTTYDTYDLKFDYHAVINYNSGVGIQAALRGSPVVVDQSSLAHPVSISIADIEDAEVPDRNQWLIEISHTEYTVEEIRQGLWLKRLAGKLSKD